MFVRVLQQQEMMTALQLMRDTFMIDVAPGCSQEGINTFQRQIEYSNVTQRISTGELVCFGAFEGVQLLGAGVLQNGKHILHLFVQKVHQGVGIERILFQEMCKYSIHHWGVGLLTTDAMPNMAALYQTFGMRMTESQKMGEGIPYIPMEMFTDAGMLYPPQKSQAGLIIGILGVCLLLVIAVAALGVNMVNRATSQFQYGYGAEEVQPYEDWSYGEDLYGSEEQVELSGLDQIPAYKQEGLTYSIEEEIYEYENVETKTTSVYFDVVYPKIVGLDEAVQEKVNEVLKKTAMETVEEIYLNPSEEVKERVLEADYPMLDCYTSYKVVYQGADFMSVAFEEMSYEGSAEVFVNQIRTVNINLKDGTVYEIKDIVKLEEAFLTDWLERMREEAEISEFLSELDQEQMKKALSGDDLEGVYFDCFFVHEDGIEIGFSFQYPSGDPNDLGYIWVTAPFSVEELKEYQTESEFWKENF